MKFKQKGAFKIKRAFSKAAKVMLAIALVLLYSGARLGTASAAGGTNGSSGMHEISKTIQYHCASVTSFDMPVTIKATVPDSVKPGETFMIKNSSSTVTLPADVVSTLKTLLRADTISGQATLFEVKSSNKDKTVNVANPPIPIPETVVPNSGTLTFSVPGEGGVDAGPYTAGQSGEMAFYAGNINTTIIVHNALGDTPISANCSPVEGADTKINTVPIQEEQVDQPPVITLKGDNPMQLEVGDAYKDPGATADDKEDGDLTDKIKVTGDVVNPDKIGTYKVTYSVTDSAGHTTTVDRTVNVVKPAGSIMYHCDTLVPFDMPVIIKGDTPKSVKPGSDVVIKNSQTIVKIPASTADVMRSLGAHHIKGTTDEFMLSVTNNDATIDVAQQHEINLPETTLPESGPLKLTVPEQGLEVTGLKAGTDGEMIIKAGEIKTTMILEDAIFPNLEIGATCNPVEGEDTTTNTITIDGEKPALTLNGDNPLTVEYGSTFHDPGAKAIDNVDGDLTNQIQVTGEVDTHKLGTYTLTYTVSDNAGNTATAERTVKVVDTEKPKITLKGDNPMTVELGSTFEDPGATATDNVDGDLTDKIQVTGEVNTDEYGTYTVTYSVTDSSGNTATATRTVHVVKSSGTVNPGDNEGTKVYPGEQVTIGDSGAVLTMPDDLPVGTTLKVTDVSNSDEVVNAPDLILAGEVYHFDIQYPDGQAPKGKFNLTLTYDAAKYSPDQVDIYYYNEKTGKWEKLNGKVDPENGTITVEVTHFSTYGVFAKADNSGGDNGNNGGNNNGGNNNGDNGGSDNGGNGGNDNGNHDNGGTGNGNTGNGGNNGGSGNGGSAGGVNGQGGQLPETATMNPIGIAFGFILAAIGAFILARKKKLAR
jgi:LPXTG-motif cell wall-anchored protein